MSPGEAGEAWKEQAEEGIGCDAQRKANPDKGSCQRRQRHILLIVGKLASIGGREKRVEVFMGT